MVNEARGTRRVYRVDSVALSALKDQLDTFWQRALSGFSEVTKATLISEQQRIED